MSQRGSGANPGRIRTNLRHARTRYAEGGSRLVMRRGLAKSRSLMSRMRQSLRRVSRPVSREQFDSTWYARYYGLSPTQLAMGPYEHYRQHGHRKGLSPTAEARAASSSTNPLHDSATETVRDDFDPDWYVEEYPEVGVLCARGTVVSPLWHYVTEGAATGRSPNGWFDEQWYLQTYPDVAVAKALGGTPFGFVHYLHHGRGERRSPSKQARPSTEAFEGLSLPVAFERLKQIERALSPFAYRIYPASGTPRVNVLLPTLDKNLMFGGYIAALNFLNELLNRGWNVRILIVNDVRATSERLIHQFADDPLGSSVLDRAEIVQLSRRTAVLDLTTDDRFVAYSMWTAHHADVFAKAVGRRFVFFIQEFEPTFHHHDSWHAVGAAMYDKPHFALFNNALLRRFFREERLGVFAGGDEEGLANSAVFEHALSVPEPPTVDQLERDTATRRLLFYGRPEAHAARNLYEVGIIGLRKAVADGVFEGDWEFHGVGSLSTDAGVALGKGYALTLRPRLPLGDYVSELRSFDVGLSLQYAPHPGVVHFEMAASGMATVTNTFSNRTAEDLREISANLVGVPPTPEGIAEGLAAAVSAVPDIEARVKGAAGSWSTSWPASFNDDVMSSIEAELR